MSAFGKDRLGDHEESLTKGLEFQEVQKEVIFIHFLWIKSKSKSESTIKLAEWVYQSSDRELQYEYEVVKALYGNSCV